MSTFNERLKEAIGDRGYEAGMRRSVQTVILYESKRCLRDNMQSLRPFQRKAAFHSQCYALLETLDFISPALREEVMWRTGTKRECVDQDTAWKRVKNLERQLSALAKKVNPFCNASRTHEESCNAFLQAQYEAVSGRPGTPYPLHWEHVHSNLIMCYRLYYRNGELDPTFPPPSPPKEIIVPARRPGKDASKLAIMDGSIDAGPVDSPTGTAVIMHSVPTVAGDAAAATTTHGPSAHAPGAATGGASARLSYALHGSSVGMVSAEQAASEQRRLILKEVKEHVELLNEFEGVVSDEEIRRRKQDLFLALPPAPPAKKQRKL